MCVCVCVCVFACIHGCVFACIQQSSQNAIRKKRMSTSAHFASYFFFLSFFLPFFLLILIYRPNELREHFTQSPLTCTYYLVHRAASRGLKFISTKDARRVYITKKKEKKRKEKKRKNTKNHGNGDDFHSGQTSCARKTYTNRSRYFYAYPRHFSFSLPSLFHLSLLLLLLLLILLLLKVLHR